MKENVLEHILQEPAPVLGMGLSASWDLRDMKYLDKIFTEIRMNRSQSRWFEPFIMSMNDQFMDRRTGRQFEANTVSVDMNALTTEGLRLCNQRITGEINQGFNYMMSGTGNSVKPTMYSEHLEAENSRIAIDQQGWFFARGTTLTQGCKFPTSVPTATIREFGSSNVSDPGDPDHTLFWRSRITDSSQLVNHVQYETVYLHVHLVDFRSISE